MTKRLVLGAVIATVALWFVPASASPPETIVISIQNIETTNPPVTFDHRLHWEKAAECAECHHRDPQPVGQKCSGCHGGNPEIMKVPMRQAYHRLCIGCHGRIQKGPVKCTGCHRVEERALASPAPDRRELSSP